MVGSPFLTSYIQKVTLLRNFGIFNVHYRESLPPSSDTFVTERGDEQLARANNHSQITDLPRRISDRLENDSHILDIILILHRSLFSNTSFSLLPNQTTMSLHRLATLRVQPSDLPTTHFGVTVKRLKQHQIGYLVWTNGSLSLFIPYWHHVEHSRRRPIDKGDP